MIAFAVNLIFCNLIEWTVRLPLIWTGRQTDGRNKQTKRCMVRQTDGQNRTQTDRLIKEK